MSAVTAKATLPVARLRAAGCRVSHLTGHYPDAGIWGLSVRLPESVPLPDRWTSASRATLTRADARMHRVLVEGYARRGADARPSREDIHDTAAAVSLLLTKLANHVEDSAAHAALDSAWREAFDALRASGVEADSDHPVAARYRDASNAVNHSNRARDFTIATGGQS